MESKATRSEEGGAVDVSATTELSASPRCPPVTPASTARSRIGRAARSFGQTPSPSAGAHRGARSGSRQSVPKYRDSMVSAGPAGPDLPAGYLLVPVESGPLDRVGREVWNTGGYCSLLRV